MGFPHKYVETGPAAGNLPGRRHSSICGAVRAKANDLQPHSATESVYSFFENRNSDAAMEKRTNQKKAYALGLAAVCLWSTAATATSSREPVASLR